MATILKLSEEISGAKLDPTRNGAGTARIARHLKHHGWARFNLHDLLIQEKLDRGFPQFAARAASCLPVDPYDESCARRRRYGVFVWIPASRQLIAVSRHFDAAGNPIVPYTQDSTFQSEFGGDVRWFAGLKEELLNDPFLLTLVETDAAIAISSGALPHAVSYYVGLHVISLQPTGSDMAVITPDELHCDGEPVTFAHLLDRMNVVGGENTVADVGSVGAQPGNLGPASMRAQFTLHDSGDGFVVDDRMVSHHVSGVELKNNAREGRRCVALVDFCPAKRTLSNEL